VLKTKRLQFSAKPMQSMMTPLMKSVEVIIFRTIKSPAKYRIASSSEDTAFTRAHRALRALQANYDKTTTPTLQHHHIAAT
jgi:hypothetical protein